MNTLISHLLPNAPNGLYLKLTDGEFDIRGVDESALNVSASEWLTLVRQEASIHINQARERRKAAEPTPAAMAKIALGRASPEEVAEANRYFDALEAAEAWSAELLERLAALRSVSAINKLMADVDGWKPLPAKFTYKLSPLEYTPKTPEVSDGRQDNPTPGPEAGAGGG